MTAKDVDDLRWIEGGKVASQYHWEFNDVPVHMQCVDEAAVTDQFIFPAVGLNFRSSAVGNYKRYKGHPCRLLCDEEMVDREQKKLSMLE